MLHFILPNASNAHHTIVIIPRQYVARVFVLRENGRLLGCYADNMISTLFSFASYHQYRTDGIIYIDSLLYALPAPRAAADNKNTDTPL